MSESPSQSALFLVIAAALFIIAWLCWRMSCLHRQLAGAYQLCADVARVVEGGTPLSLALDLSDKGVLPINPPHAYSAEDRMRLVLGLLKGYRNRKDLA